MSREKQGGGHPSRAIARRIVIFGVTGHLGQQVVDQLDESGWPITELIGVASTGSVGAEFEFRGLSIDVVGEWPVLKGWDLVLICTPPAEALGIVREALRAEVPCVDCTGALTGQADVPMPLATSIAAALAEMKKRLPEGEGESEAISADAPVAIDDDRVGEAPLLAIPSATTLAWLPVLLALDASRVVATVLSSASSQGHRGIAALSEESIALFNQSAAPEAGPAGQAVAFDVVPGGGIDCERVRREMRRLFGSAVRVAVASVQVPTFVGEGASLALELRNPLTAKEIEDRLDAMPGVTIAREGLGSRGLAVIEEGAPEPIGPTLRDSIGADEVLVGRIEADDSLPSGTGWRLWIVFDPLRLSAEQALRLAGRRLGLA